MAIPDYETIMLPLLGFLGDGHEHSMQEAVEALSKHFNLSESELKELLPSGQQFLFYNRVGWARTYMKKAGLIDTTRRGYIQITHRGRDVLESHPEAIDSRFLERFEEFRAFKVAARGKPAKTKNETVQAKTPQEELENAYQDMRNTLADDLLSKIKESTPDVFERIVVDLLVAMGYGGNIKDAGKAVGKAGDEGIDGTIKEDRLGLDIIYIQAKKWDCTVGRPEVQKFAGALQGQRAKKGIFLTTSDFSREAKDYASQIDSKIVLIDGISLAQYMIDFNIGVNPVTSFEIKKADSDYFDNLAST